MLPAWGVTVLFIDDRPAFASGKGELLEPIELTLAGYRIIIVKPSFGVSTPEAYAGITPRRPDMICVSSDNFR